MKRILVKNRVIVTPAQEATYGELGEILTPYIPEVVQAGEVIHQAELDDSGVDFFISHRPQYICEVIDMTAEVEAKKAKKDKRKAAKDKFKNFDKSKLTTIAACREAIADIVDILDDEEQD
jgi:hypothetical protein